MQKLNATEKEKKKLLRIHKDINLLFTTKPKQYHFFKTGEKKKKKVEWFLPHIDMSQN